jgi:nitroreductase
MELIPEIADWQSTRKFTDEGVEAEALTRILEAGRKAPSAKNRQPWRFVVVKDGSTRVRIESASFGQEHVGQAPVIVAACTTNVDYKMPNGQWSYPIDLTMAVSFMMLQAGSEELGSCVVTTYNEQEIKEILTVPYSMRVAMLLLIGHSAEKPFPTQRKPLDRIISYDHW